MTKYGFGLWASSLSEDHTVIVSQIVNSSDFFNVQKQFSRYFAITSFAVTNIFH